MLRVNDILSKQKIKFGLVQQGHISTIKKMLDEKKSWNEIGIVIFWEANTAKKHYERYLVQGIHA